jgi:hypothetical protein
LPVDCGITGTSFDAVGDLAGALEDGIACAVAAATDPTTLRRLSVDLSSWLAQNGYDLAAIDIGRSLSDAGNLLQGLGLARQIPTLADAVADGLTGSFSGAATGPSLQLSPARPSPRAAEHRAGAGR